MMGLTSNARAHMLPVVGIKGERIRELRKAKGWTTTDLGTRARVSQSTVSRIESGDTKQPDVPTLERVAVALGVALGDIYVSETNADELRIVRDPEERTPEDDETPLEQALYRVRDPSKHTRDDFAAALRAVQKIHRFAREETSVDDMAREYLEGARRTRDVPERERTEAILGYLIHGRHPDQRAAMDERTRIATEAAGERARELGYGEPGEFAHVLQPKPPPEPTAAPEARGAGAVGKHVKKATKKGAK